VANREGAPGGPGVERGRAEETDDRAVYIISVAAELAGVHPQTLRIYERKGLLTPARTAGNTRRYSERDIARLQSIQRLTQELGVNLAGVERILEMERELDRLRGRMRDLSRALERSRRQMRDEVERHRRQKRTEIVPLSSVPRLRVRTQGLGPTPQRRGPIAVGPGS
jgi:MerR family transcriptional regulator/heat shock protein HspR